MATSRLVVDKISKTFRAHDQIVPALAEINFAAGAGEFVTVIGPSGCGKSTLFNIIVGLTEADTGRICLDGEELHHRAGLFGYMPQRDLLLPWRTVIDNVILGPELAGQSRRAAREEAAALLPLFGLAGFGDAYPATLSGGMRQRAALLRTFLTQREVMLFDEPFGALDALTRRDLQMWLLDIWRQFNKTILFITHDVEEALFLSDRVLVMSSRPGRIALNLPIDLPRPRQTELLVEARFTVLKAQLLTTLGV